MMEDIPFYPTTNLLIPLPTGAGHWSMGWAGYKAHYLIIATAPPGPLGDLVAVLLRLDLTAGPPFSQEGPYLFVAARPLPRGTFISVKGLELGSAFCRGVPIGGSSAAARYDRRSDQVVLIRGVQGMEAISVYVPHDERSLPSFYTLNANLYPLNAPMGPPRSSASIVFHFRQLFQAVWWQHYRALMDRHHLAIFLDPEQACGSLFDFLYAELVAWDSERRAVVGAAIAAQFATFPPIPILVPTPPTRLTAALFTELPFSSLEDDFAIGRRIRPKQANGSKKQEEKKSKWASEKQGDKAGKTTKKGGKKDAFSQYVLDDYWMGTRPLSGFALANNTSGVGEDGRNMTSPRQGGGSMVEWSHILLDRLVMGNSEPGKTADVYDSDSTAEDINRVRQGGGRSRSASPVPSETTTDDTTPASDTYVRRKYGMLSQFVSPKEQRSLMFGDTELDTRCLRSEKEVDGRPTKEIEEFDSEKVRVGSPQSVMEVVGDTLPEEEEELRNIDLFGVAFFINPLVKKNWSPVVFSLMMQKKLIYRPSWRTGVELLLQVRREYAGEVRRLSKQFLEEHTLPHTGGDFTDSVRITWQELGLFATDRRAYWQNCLDEAILSPESFPTFIPVLLGPVREGATKEEVDRLSTGMQELTLGAQLAQQAAPEKLPTTNPRVDARYRTPIRQNSDVSTPAQVGQVNRAKRLRQNPEGHLGTKSTWRVHGSNRGCPPKHQLHHRSPISIRTCIPTKWCRIRH